MKTYYLGAFPPEYGGVTIKNENLFKALNNVKTIEKIDFNQIKQKNVKVALRFVCCILRRDSQYIIGVSGKETRRMLTKLLSTVNRTAMKRSVIIIMGGTAARDIAFDRKYQKWASNYKRIYVETNGMLKQLLDAGIENGAFYPNGRFKPNESMEIIDNQKEILRCVYFSQVSEVKGVDLVLKAAASLPNIRFDIYGSIVEKYRNEFLKEIQGYSNVLYCGVYKKQGDQLYRLLNSYDIMLLPTRWKNEGVPGIIVESKIAGLACIVSNLNYNSELVKDGKEGIVLSENSAEQLIHAIEMLNKNRDLLFKLKKGSKASAEQYYIENYVDEILAELV